MVINGDAHGPERHHHLPAAHAALPDGDTIDVEPWRAAAFPVVKDLVVDRRAFDRIIQAGGYITAPTGTAPDAHAMPVPKPDADAAFEAPTCIGCGACVAACPNGSAMLFTAAKVTHLNLLPQGQPERDTRVLDMVAAEDAEGFGGCTNTGECTAVCPKGIPLDDHHPMNKEWLEGVQIHRGVTLRRGAQWPLEVVPVHRYHDSGWPRASISRGTYSWVASLDAIAIIATSGPGRRRSAPRSRCRP